MFQEKYPQLKDVVKYEYYLKHYKSNYGYRFGRPQVDVCSTCEELNIKIKSPFLNETAKRCAVAELIVHKRRSSKFYKKFEEIKNLGIDTPNVTGLAFDYMQSRSAFYPGSRNVLSTQVMALLSLEFTISPIMNLCFIHIMKVKVNGTR